jgi:chromate transporter
MCRRIACSADTGRLTGGTVLTENRLPKTEDHQRKEEAPLQKHGRLLQLFLVTLYLSAFTFGGGYVIISLLQKKIVDEYHWIDSDEMLDLVAIAQSAPGPIAVNGAIAVGYRVAGIPGILLATLGAVIPPFVIISIISFFYQAFKTNFVVGALLSGMKSGVSAVIISVVWDMASGIVKDRDRENILIMILTFIAGYFFGINTVWIILAAAAAGTVRTIRRDHHEKKTAAPGKEKES